MEKHSANEISLSSLGLDQRGLLSGQYWGELRIFAEVARAKSFNRAAEALRVSQPTIGRKVRRLQDVLGTQLFVATKHGVRLTEQGEMLAAAVFRLDQSLHAIARDLKRREDDIEGSVSIAMTDGMAAFFAAPAIPEFSARYPRIRLHLKGMADLASLRENGTDMMLTFAPITASDCVCRRLGTLHFVPFATHDYIARHGLPTRERIGEHALLQSHLYSNDNVAWQDWHSLCAAGRVAHQCDNSFAYGMLVKAGVGIGLLGSYAAGERNAVPLELGVRAALPFYAVVLCERLESRSVERVFEWLCQTFDASNAWFGDRIDFADPSNRVAALDDIMAPHEHAAIRRPNDGSPLHSRRVSRSR